ncbi:MAG: hemerythrin domain-containing protein [Vicinamibacterales bacterium]
MPIQIGKRPDHGFDEPLGLLSDCHRRIEHFLWVIAVRSREAAGGPLSDSQRTDLDGALRYFSTAAPRHTADEEGSLFPRLRAVDDARVAAALRAIERLEADHDVANQHHAEVDRLVRQWIDEGHVPAADHAALTGHVEALQALYREHIAFEDRELFPAAARTLTPAQQADIGAEMARRRGLTSE